MLFDLKTCRQCANPPARLPLKKRIDEDDALAYRRTQRLFMEFRYAEMTWYEIKRAAVFGLVDLVRELRNTEILPRRGKH